MTSSFQTKTAQFPYIIRGEFFKEKFILTTKLVAYV